VIVSLGCLRPIFLSSAPRVCNHCQFTGTRGVVGAVDRCLSLFRPSVTRQYCVKTAKHIAKNSFTGIIVAIDVIFSWAKFGVTCTCIVTIFSYTDKEIKITLHRKHWDRSSRNFLSRRPVVYSTQSTSFHIISTNLLRVCLFCLVPISS